MAATAANVNAIRQGILASRVASAPTERIPGRWMLHAGPGWGKTSFGAKFPKPIFLQSQGETGLQTLIEYGQLPPTPFLPAATSWREVLQYIKALRDEEHDYKTLVIDTINGLEQLLRSFVIGDEFEGSEKDFMAFGKGEVMVATKWSEFLAALDNLRLERRMVVVLLCHTIIKSFNNPTGSNYDRYTPEMSGKIFGPTYKWVDGALFGAFETQLIGKRVKPDQKVKVSADVQDRILYTEETAAWSAKQRHGLPPEIECGESADQAYANFTKALKRGLAPRPVAQPQAVAQEAPPAAPEPAAEPERTPAPEVPEPVQRYWGRMKSDEDVNDVMFELVEQLDGLVGSERREVEWKTIADQFAAGRPTNPMVRNRFVLETWKRIQELRAVKEASDGQPA